mgnify:CR=1 FL=1
MDESGERDKRIRIAVGTGQKMNLISLDDVTDIMLALSERADSGQPVFNIVSRHPIDCRETLALISRHTGLQVIPCETGELRHVPKTRYELLASYMLDYIHPYLRNEVSFDTGHTEAVQDSLSVLTGTNFLEAAIRDFVASLAARGRRVPSAPAGLSPQNASAFMPCPSR